MCVVQLTPNFLIYITKYVCIVGPKLNTVEDFWQMIWQKNILLIAMVTNLTEGSSVSIAYISLCFGCMSKKVFNLNTWTCLGIT